jgi:hypothetical protein
MEKSRAFYVRIFGRHYGFGFHLPLRVFEVLNSFLEE